jgi:hypothetical protein
MQKIHSSLQKKSSVKYFSVNDKKFSVKHEVSSLRMFIARKRNEGYLLGVYLNVCLLRIAQHDFELPVGMTGTAGVMRVGGGRGAGVGSAMWHVPSKAPTMFIGDTSAKF